MKVVVCVVGGGCKVDFKGRCRLKWKVMKGLFSVEGEGF